MENIKVEEGDLVKLQNLSYPNIDYFFVSKGLENGFFKIEGKSDTFHISEISEIVKEPEYCTLDSLHNGDKIRLTDYSLGDKSILAGNVIRYYKTHDETITITNVEPGHAIHFFAESTDKEDNPLTICLQTIWAKTVLLDNGEIIKVILGVTKRKREDNIVEPEDLDPREPEAQKLYHEMSEFIKSIEDKYAAWNIISSLIHDYLLEYFKDDYITLIAENTPTECRVNLNRLIRE